MRESKIDAHLAGLVAARGGLYLKQGGNGISGIPDRLCVLPKGVHIWVELKATGQKPRPLQVYWAAELFKRGAHVQVVDSFGAAERLMHQYDEGKYGKIH